MGKEYVRAMVAFFTNDLPQFEPVAGWSSSGRTVSTGQNPGRRRSATIRRRATCAFCRVTAVDTWQATVRSLPPLSSRSVSAPSAITVVLSRMGVTATRSHPAR